MKVEFIKETKVDGGVYFYTKLNGEYVSNSTSISEEKGKEYYEKIKAGTFGPKTEVLDLYEEDEDIELPF